MRVASTSALLLLALTPPAAAQLSTIADRDIDLVAGEEEPIKYKYRFPVMVLEQLLWTLPPTIYYYSTTNLQREDFELKWDKESWKRKLVTFDGVVFDTGNWNSNAFRHSVFGSISYQIGRANGYSPFAATLIDFTTAVIWEYVVEYRELVSLNDLMVNTISGFMIGEPLYQLGRLGDHKDVSWARRAVAAVASPVHTAHVIAGYPGWKRDIRPWTDFEVSMGANLADYGSTRSGEVGVDIDLELIREARYGVPGTGSQWTGLAAFNRVMGQARFGEGELSRTQFRTATTFFGKYSRSIDDTIHGSDSFFGLATGFDYETRDLPVETDRFALFHLFGPKLELGLWRGTSHLSWETGAYLDMGMMQAHVFGPVLPFPKLPQTSVLQTRGYYFGGGLSATTRLRLETPMWSAELEGRAYQLWSIDGRDRMETGAGADDPRNVSDTRFIALAAVGIRPGIQNAKFELTLEATSRRGAWQDDERTTKEITTGARVGLPF